MQIQTDAIPTFRPIVATLSRPGGTQAGTNVADTRTPDEGADVRSSSRRERFGAALLRRIDAGDLRGLRDAGREFKFGRRLVQRTRRDANEALRDGAKHLVKGVKKELRSVLRELGDDKQARKEVRGLFKEFRRDVKDVVKSTRSSRQFDTEAIAGDLEDAYNALTEGLRDALDSGPRTDSIPYEPTSLVDPANGTSVARDTPQGDPGGTIGGVTADPADQADDGQGSSGGAQEADPSGTTGVTALRESPPASVAETEPEPEPDPAPNFDGLFGRLDGTFKDSVGDIVRGINDALERAHEAFDRFRRRHGGGGSHSYGRGRFVDRAA